MIRCISPLFLLFARALNVFAEDLSCGIWFAKSTIPGAGLGIFAGIAFEEDEEVLPIGDVVVPIVDKEIHQPDDHNFLWDEYTWDGRGMFMDFEGYHSKLSAASPGFGAAVNCYMDLVNIKESVPLNSNTGLHRSKDPGAGAFSTYWNRQSIATTSIKPGHELFASYGESWFKSRENIGPVPLKGDLLLGDQLLKKYERLKNYVNSKIDNEALKDLWELFVWNNPWNESSRVLFGLPRNWDDINVASNITLLEFTRQKHSVTLDWLGKNGICGDWIIVKKSTFPQAGRGAFARRNFEAGEIVAPFPLIHLPYRIYLDMFEIEKDEDGEFEATDRKITTQLLLNYCMGHRESTLLLCPYGTLSSYINHNQTLTNVELVWADPKSSNHKPEWLNKSLSELYNTHYAGLAMNLKATRPIHEDEELFLNYGDEWEIAWQNHIKNWAPVKGASKYKSAEEHNVEVVNVKTAFEALFKPYPDNVAIHVNLAFDQPRRNWMRHWKVGTISKFILKEDEYTSKCDILRRERDKEDNVWYTVQINTTNDHTDMKESNILVDLPREALIFFDEPHTTDMHQLSAHRHDIRIPDSLFPDIWKNTKQRQT